MAWDQGLFEKKFSQPQWLRNIKAKKYSKLRLDIFLMIKNLTI